MTTTKKTTIAPSAMSTLLRETEAYLSHYVTFSTPDYAFALALWAAATYLWPHFDAFPYLVITSDTKRSGKTRLSEVLSFVSSNPRNMAGMTAATLFRSIRDENPTIFIDEAETLSSESADTMRSVLNVGYRKGQTIPRMGKNGVEEWPAYCPKVFILIGDVFDTLRDRSIIVRMRRGDAPQRFLYEIAKGNGGEIGSRLATGLADAKETILDGYMTSTGLTFLQDRDEEIWMPLFAVAQALCPERMDELTRVAVDMSTEKTADKRRHTALEMETAERNATDIEYAERLLQDMLTVMGHRRNVFTAEVITLLYALPTGPWRKFRGMGLTASNIADLLSRFAVTPRLIRTGGSKNPNSKVQRGYRREDIEAAIAANW